MFVISPLASAIEPCELPELCEELLVSGMLAPAMSPESLERVLLSKSPLSPDDGVCPLSGIG